MKKVYSFSNHRSMSQIFTTESSLSTSEKHLHYHKTTNFKAKTDNLDDLRAMMSDNGQGHPGVIVPATITGLLLCLVLFIFSYEYFRMRLQPSEPQEDTILILCTENDATYEYLMILRVGCPTSSFDKKTYLDVEILGEGDVLLGYTVRFACALLGDPFCSELHLFIGSLTPLEITSIAMNHGSRHGSIFLFDYILRDLSDDSLIEIVAFNTYLTDQKVIYRGQPWNDSENDYIPEIPVLELTLAETLLISTFLVFVSGGAVVLVEYFNVYKDVSLSKEDGSLFRSLLDILYIAPLTIILLSAVVMSYKYYFKLNLLRCEFSLNQTKLHIWRTHLKLYKLALLILSICSAAMTIYFSAGGSFTRSLYWYSTTLVLAIIILGTWLLCNSSNWLISHFDNGFTAKSDKYKRGLLSSTKDLSSSNAPKNHYLRKSGAPFEKTILFPEKGKSKKHSKASKTSRGGISGPVLFNPKMIRKKKNAKKGGGKLLARKRQKGKSSKRLATISSKKKKRTYQGIEKSSKKHKKSSSKKSKKTNLKSTKTKTISSKKRSQKTPTKSRRSGRRIS